MCERVATFAYVILNHPSIQQYIYLRETSEGRGAPTATEHVRKRSIQSQATRSINPHTLRMGERNVNLHKHAHAHTHSHTYAHTHIVHNPAARQRFRRTHSNTHSRMQPSYAHAVECVSACVFAVQCLVVLLCVCASTCTQSTITHHRSNSCQSLFTVELPSRHVCGLWTAAVACNVRA